MPGGTQRARRRAENRAWLQAQQRRRVAAFVLSQEQRRAARDRLARDTGLHVVELHGVAEEFDAMWQTR
jgi:hypothetical protein